MVAKRRLIVVALLIAAASAPAFGTVKTVANVPSYIWYNGCGPTAIGMIIGYWDAQGYPNLIPGSNDWNTNQQAIEDSIASAGHIRDYVPTPDRVATPEDPYHANDSIADFSKTSRNPDDWGWGYFAYQDDGFIGYALYRGYYGSTATNVGYASLWSQFVTAIDNNRPVELLVDSGTDGVSDHFITAIGYDDTPGALRYYFYDTWTDVIRSQPYHPMAVNNPWGVYGGTFFQLDIPDRPPGDANRDGQVDVGDLGILATNYGRSGMTWAQGDFNGDGMVDVGDLGILASHYGADITVPPSSGGLPVPEPATMVLLAVAGAAVLRRRR